MKRKVWTGIGLTLLLLLLAGGAFVGARLLTAGSVIGGAAGEPRVRVATGDGQVVDAQWVRAEGMPESSPDVSGAFAGRQDNSIFVDETEGGFLISKGEDGSFSVTNTTGKISEVVVASETLVYVDETLDNMDEALSDGQLHQRVQPGTVEEIGEMSFVRAWGERRGDRLIASVLLYNRPPVISR
jgi:hypothetical protein